MKLNYTSVLNKTNTNTAGSLIPITLADMYTPFNVRPAKKRLSTNRNNKKKPDVLKSNKEADEIRKKRMSLKIDVIQEMLSRFLLEKKMSKERLAGVLYITVEELECLLSQEEVEEGLIYKINLPLITLYCETKFVC